MNNNPIKSDIIIKYDTIKLHNAASNAGIFNGVNVQFGWSTHSKGNTGLGTIGGHDNYSPKNTSLVLDSNYIDTIINDQDYMLSIK